MVLIEADKEFAEVCLVFRGNAGYKLFWRQALCLCTQHDGCAVCIVSAYVVAVVAAQSLETYPDVRLNVFDHMAEVDWAVRVWEGAGDKNGAHRDCHEFGQEPMDKLLN